MVMMGQQLMDSERKKEEDDDDYVIQTHTNYKSSQKTIEIPTLAALAAVSHENNLRRQSVEERAEQFLQKNGYDSNTETIVKVAKNKVDESGDGTHNEAAGVGGATLESSSSGRNSSCGGDSSSGIGNSLTCSSSASEPIERDVLSPSSEQEDDQTLNINSSACQALLLAEDFNGQMTAAKRFLQMVRNGIKEEDARGIGIKFEDVSDDDNKLILKEKSRNNRKEQKSAGGSPIMEKCPPCVQEVWAHNLMEEFCKIRQIVKHYPFIAMDTEFPGIVVRPHVGGIRAGCVFPYEMLKANVDCLKIIQLGVTFMDKSGRTPSGVCTWQFNFKFNLQEDMYAADSISLLTRCGIRFEKHAQEGIDPLVFGEYFMSSGMVTTDQVTYLTFHSGFDFGYLIKLLSNAQLPTNEEQFFEIMKIYFPVVYDLKFLMKSVDLHGGLQDIANQMGQLRVGTQHQAGSDSLLTGQTFFKLQTEVFNGEIDANKYLGKLYGFHMTADGRDDGWVMDPGDMMLDPTSPRLITSSSTTCNGSNSIRESIPSSILSSVLNGESR